MPLLASNKKARFDYQLLEKYEAGLALFGYEAKSAKMGQVSLKGSFITVRTSDGRPELYIVNCQISPYKNAGPLPGYDPRRERKLLLHRREIDSLVGKSRTEGLTLIPLEIYTNHSFLKLRFAVGKGKKLYDKREAIKKRDLDRRLRSFTKRS